MPKGFRQRIKKNIPAGFWPFFRSIDKYVIDLLYAYFMVRRHLSQKKCCVYLHPFKQSIPCFVSHIDLGVNPSKTLSKRFNEAGLNFKSGRHSIYIESSDDIGSINDKIIKRYPQPIGLKIVKSREISPDNSPYYTSRKLAPASSWFSMIAVGTMLEKIVVSNLLNTVGFAPRVHDIIRLDSKDGGWQYAFIVHHVEGQTINGKEGERFIKKFCEALIKFGIKVISINEHSDLRPPDFRNNIVGNNKQIFYVDVQNFAIFDDIFVRKIADQENKIYKNGLSSKSLYWFFDRSKSHDQNQYKRFQNSFQQFLKNNDLDLTNNIVIDISTDRAFFCLNCLAKGIRWCFLLRGKKESKRIYSLMTLLGYSRFQITDSLNKVSRLLLRMDAACILYLTMDNLGKLDDYRKWKFPCEYLMIETELRYSPDMMLYHQMLMDEYEFSASLDIPNEISTSLKWLLFKKKYENTPH